MAWRVAVAVLAGVLAWPAQPVLAQGFLQPYFGNGPPSSRLYGYPGPRPYPYAGVSPYRSLYARPSPYPFGFGPTERGDDPPLSRPGTYRTLCVRLCDGFYFPISSATNGSGLSRDADACTASCGSEARLYFHPNGGGDVDSMVDLTGLAYSALPNAFRYRKALVPECRCRPQPWSDAELQRHRAYAAGRPGATDAAGPAPPLADENRMPPAAAPGVVERPEPARIRAVAGRRHRLGPLFSLQIHRTAWPRPIERRGRAMVAAQLELSTNGVQGRTTRGPIARAISFRGAIAAARSRVNSGAPSHAETKSRPSPLIACNIAENGHVDDRVVFNRLGFPYSPLTPGSGRSTHR